MTRLVATIRASMDHADCAWMIASGITCFRLNCSRLTENEVLDFSKLLRATAGDAGIPITLFADLPGSKARIWAFGQRRYLDVGDRLIIYRAIEPDDNGCVQIVGPELFDAIKAGDVLIVRRKTMLRLLVTQVREDSIQVRALCQGAIGEGYHIVIDNKYVPSLTLTPLDYKWLQVIAYVEPEFICPSFVDSAQIIDQARIVTSAFGKSPSILAKVESPIGLSNLASIIEASDGIVIGRDDLSMWLSPEALQETTLEIIVRAKSSRRLTVPASNFFSSVITEDCLNESDLRNLLAVLSLEPDYVYCNETSVSLDFEKIVRCAHTLGLIHGG